MNIYDEVSKIWIENKPRFEANTAEWAERLLAAKKGLKDARGGFRQWKSLKVYLPVARVKDREFSLRFCGQEVATLKKRKDKEHKDGAWTLMISKRHETKNREFFEEYIPKSLALKKGGYLWQSEEAKRIRQDFEEIPISLKTGVLEHRIESWMLSEMVKSTSDKFKGSFKGIQPITFAGCPFQMPVPVSGSSGVPKATKGNIDILARRRKGNRTRLSVWELKSPGKVSSSSVVRQASIYAVTLIHILRSPSGDRWWKLFGFSGKPPQRLEIEAVMAVSEKDGGQLVTQWQNVKKDLCFQTPGGDQINYCAACYDFSEKNITSFVDL